MTCTIADVASTLVADGSYRAIRKAGVSVVPSIVPLFTKQGGVFEAVQNPQPNVTTDNNGNFSLTLPWPSESNPSNVQWQLILPDGTVWLGTVPEGVVGPLTVYQLKTTYGWSLVAGGLTSTIVGIQGTPGVGGAGDLVYADFFRDVVVTGLKPTTGAGLNVNVAAGTIYSAGQRTTYAGGSTALPNNTTANYLDTNGTLFSTNVLASPAAGYVRLAQFTTAGGAITQLVDLRRLDLRPSSGRSLNPMDFGAKGDGVTNDAAAFLACVAALPPTGGRIEIPAGRYAGLTTLTLTVPTVIQGAGTGQNPPRYGTYLDFGSADQPGIIVTNTAEKSVIRDLFIGGPNANTNPGAIGTSDGLSIKATESWYENIAVNGFSRDGIVFDTTVSGNATNAKGMNCQANVNARYGLNCVGGNSQGLLFVGCDFTNNGLWGIRNGINPSNGAAANGFIQCHCSQNGTSSTIQAGATVTAIPVAAGMGAKYTVGQTIAVATVNGYVLATINSIVGDTLNITSLGGGNNPTIGGLVVQGGAIYENSSSSHYYHTYIEADGHGGVWFDSGTFGNVWIGAGYGDIQVLYPMSGSALNSNDFCRAPSGLGQTHFNPFRFGDIHGDHGNVPGAAYWSWASGRLAAGWMDLVDETSGFRALQLSHADARLGILRGTRISNANAGTDLIQTELAGVATLSRIDQWGRPVWPGHGIPTIANGAQGSAAAVTAGSSDARGEITVTCTNVAGILCTLSFKDGWDVTPLVHLTREDGIATEVYVSRRTGTQFDISSKGAPAAGALVITYGCDG